MQNLSMSSILFRHTEWVPWWWDNRLKIPKTNKTKSNNERNEWLRRLKIEQLCCNCHCPAVRVSAPCVCSPLIASLSRRCPGASGLMAGGMCSFLPLMSIPGPHSRFSAPLAAPPPSPQWSWRPPWGPASWQGASQPDAGPWSWPPHCPWSVSRECQVSRVRWTQSLLCTVCHTVCRLSCYL